MEFDGRIWRRRGDKNQTRLVLISTCLKAVPVPLWPRSDGWELGSRRPIFLPVGRSVGRPGGRSAAERATTPRFSPPPAVSVIPLSIRNGGPSEGLPTAWPSAQPAQHLDTDGASLTHVRTHAHTHTKNAVHMFSQTCRAFAHLQLIRLRTRLNS